MSHSKRRYELVYGCRHMLTKNGVAPHCPWPRCWTQRIGPPAASKQDPSCDVGRCAVPSRRSGSNGRRNTSDHQAKRGGCSSVGRRWEPTVYARMKVMERVTVAEIHRGAQEVITSDVTITSDRYTLYQRIPELGYHHASQYFNKSDSHLFLKWVHVFIGHATAFIDSTYHGLGTRFMQSYLDGPCYQFNRHQYPNELVGIIRESFNSCIKHSFVGFLPIDVRSG